ncbi:MAG: Prolyl-tRNA synthetase, bacterial type [Candidatus Kapaibacterium sp.]|jgi:prolyl-tRNA synthetase|nr:MAG: Prolyl-tRNA synthetase, bacterial type [Candidatus Kapabacteria bacterium]ROL57454.1 MAG: proline--tRNA ligase [Bacteroidetes/Chlorobi group bacterium Naka2016]
MKLSEYFVPTLKEVPADAVVPSHQLMLRAGLVRQVSAGVFSWLPLGFRVLNKVINILREEMNAIGAQEFLLPALNPIEIWEQTGRVEAMGDVMFHIKNREGLVLAPTHEEIITFHAKQHIQSYKDLPQIWYQIQTKFRNEPRPKSGVLRCRQFIMKDSYSMDTSWEGLDESYNKHLEAYKKIFTRCKLNFFIVGASSGAMGGSKSQEFMIESDAGEDVCAIAPSGYAANLEVATSSLSPVGRKDNCPNIEKFATPNAKTIDDLIEQFGFDENSLAKSVVYIIESEPVLILMRGNDELNETKLQSAFGTNKFRPATPEELVEITGANAGSIGPINLKKKIKIVADNLLKDANCLVSGANEDGYHLKNIDLLRDCKIDAYFDLRTVREGEPCPISGTPIKIVKAIELGHIFKLGTKYSEALGAMFLDKDGTQKPIIMGSYGIGVERIVACYIEQNHDENGIIWDYPLAPFDIHLIAINVKSETVLEKSNELYKLLISNGFEVLFDDRDETAGVKFNDADLIGIPYQIIVSERNLREGLVEIKNRRNGERKKIEIENIVEYFKENIPKK